MRNSLNQKNLILTLFFHKLTNPRCDDDTVENDKRRVARWNIAATFKLTLSHVGDVTTKAAYANILPIHFVFMRWKWVRLFSTFFCFSQFSAATPRVSSAFTCGWIEDWRKTWEISSCSKFISFFSHNLLSSTSVQFNLGLCLTIEPNSISTNCQLLSTAPSNDDYVVVVVCCSPGRQIIQQDDDSAAQRKMIKSTSLIKRKGTMMLRMFKGPQKMWGGRKMRKNYFSRLLALTTTDDNDDDEIK